MRSIVAMQMSTQLEAAFNRQITMELASSTSYLQMAAYLDGRGLTGMAGWMRAQAAEERDHALRFFDFVLARGNTVAIGAMEGPRSEFGSAQEVFENALSQEKLVSRTIAELYRLASDEVDAASFPLLQWFLQEQVEEESTVSEIIERLALAGSSGSALLQLDRELGSRGSDTGTSDD
jgi:ferritin